MSQENSSTPHENNPPEGDLPSAVAEEASEKKVEPNTLPKREESNTENTASAPPTSPALAKPKRRRTILVLTILVIAMAIIAALSGYLGFTTWNTYQKDKQLQQQELSSLKQALAMVRQENTDLSKSQKEVANNNAQSLKNLEARLQASEQQLIAQNKRLQAMSTTSREDWLLAEAEYLLKLANQRVLVERSAESADALLTEADAILRDMVDPDLFPLRQAIANDLAALRLTKSIDVEGIYLALQALAGQVEFLPVLPKPELGVSKEIAAETIDDGTEVKWWAVPWQSFKKSIAAFTAQINVKDHAEGYRPVVLMTPDTALYLKQNLRMQIERAQLSLLREQQKIYSESLLQSAQWVQDYFPETGEAQSFRQQLQRLANNNIVKTLPDISGSLELLHSYIDRMHDLKGASVKTQQGGEQ